MDVPERELVILGAGGLGREVLWALGHPRSTITNSQGEAFRPQILGFIDSNTSMHGKEIGTKHVVGGVEWLLDHPDSMVVLAVGNPATRMRVVESLKAYRARFATFISPQSIFSWESVVGQGTVVLPGAVVSTDVQIGQFVLLNPTTSVSHDCIVGDYSSLGPGVSLAGNVHVGAGCDVGTNASVIPGKRIGPNTVVGAGACVIRDVVGNMTVVGVPARLVEQRGHEGQN